MKKKRQQLNIYQQWLFIKEKSLIINLRLPVSAFILSFFLYACGGISQPPEIPGFVTISASAVLGPISAGKVNIYRLSDGKTLNTTSIETTELSYNMVSSATNTLYKNAEVGFFKATLSIPNDMTDDDLVKVVVTGGKDIDPNDNFVINPAEFKNLDGNIIAITTLAQIKRGGVVVNVLSTLAAGAVQDLSVESEIKARLNSMSRKLLSTELFVDAEKGDISGDKIVNFIDLALFNPKLQEEGSNQHYRHLANIELYQSLLPHSSDELSFVDSIFVANEQKQQTFSTNLLVGYLYRDILASILEDVDGNLDGILTSTAKLNAIAGVSNALKGREAAYLLEFKRSVSINNINKPSKEEINKIQTAISNINLWIQNTPQFNLGPTISVNESHQLVTTLLAIDVDTNDKVDFSLIDSVDGHLFTLNLEGELSAKNALDFENPTDINGDNQYQISVQITDLANNQTTQNFTIKVDNIVEENEVMDKIIKHANNGNNPLSIPEYALINLVLSADNLAAMNLLVSSKTASEVDSVEKLQLLLDYINLPIVSINTPEAHEAQNLVFVVSLSKNGINPSLNCTTTNNGSAVSGLDFVSNTMTLNSFPADFSVQTLLDDVDNEAHEMLVVLCNNPLGLRFSDVLASQISANGTILGDTFIHPVPENMLIHHSIEHTINSVFDIQGVIDAPITLLLPYTLSGTDTVDLSAYNFSVELTDGHLSETGEVGVRLNFAWQAQTLTQSDSISVTISVDDSNASGIDANDGAYQPKRLNPDINPNGVVLATFPYPIDNNNGVGMATMKIMPGILDRNFGDGQHDFLYLPVQSMQTGKVWLNHNLGANYANTKHTDFNIAQQALNYDDINAYGSLFQWGRLADGHELDGSDWLTENNANVDLWLGVNATNNVCPITFRLPTFAEFAAEFGTEKNDDLIDANNSVLKLTTTGYRNTKGDFSTSGKGYYWTSDTPDNAIEKATRFYLSNTNSNSGNYAKVNGYSVRCIKQEETPALNMNAE